MIPGAGVYRSPCASCPGSWLGGGVRGGRWGRRVLTGPGLVRPRRRAARRLQREAEPFLFAVLAFGQVEGEMAAAGLPGGAGGDGDQVPADGRGPGLREGQGG